jgi:hypothetical protein
LSIKGEKRAKGARALKLPTAAMELKAAKVMELKIAICRRLQDEATLLDYAKVTAD